MFVIDSQVHIWRADSPERPWPRDGHAVAHLAEPLSYARLLALMQDAGVGRAILVPPSWEGNRTDYALEAARMYPGQFGVMARVALEDRSSRDLVTEWKRQPGMLGVRLTFVRQAERAWLHDGTADWFWSAAEKADIPVMVHAPESAADIAAIAQRHPGLKLIIDHMGLYKITTADTRIAEAIDRTVAMSRFPNVYVKVSALPFYSVERYPFRDMYPYIRRVIEAFGPKRAFWGTDLSKMLNKFSYRVCIDHLMQMDFLSDTDKEWIMGRGIAQCLRWPLPDTRA